MHAKSLQLYLTLCDPMDHRLPGSSFRGILQTKTLKWVAMPSSRVWGPYVGNLKKKGGLAFAVGSQDGVPQKEIGAWSNVKVFDWLS